MSWADVTDAARPDCTSFLQAVRDSDISLYRSFLLVLRDFRCGRLDSIGLARVSRFLFRSHSHLLERLHECIPITPEHAHEFQVVFVPTPANASQSETAPFFPSPQHLIPLTNVILPREHESSPDSNAEGTCAVCTLQQRAIVFVPCGHTVCLDCSPQLQKCHVCRSAIHYRQRMFL
jgi:histone deacetylase complex regulatory component SIN3